MKKRILYAEANYQTIVRRSGYFVDKTVYIEMPWPGFPTIGKQFNWSFSM